MEVCDINFSYWTVYKRYNLRHPYLYISWRPKSSRWKCEFDSNDLKTSTLRSSVRFNSTFLLRPTACVFADVNYTVCLLSIRFSFFLIRRFIIELVINAVFDLTFLFGKLFIDFCTNKLRENIEKQNRHVTIIAITKNENKVNN